MNRQHDPRLQRWTIEELVNGEWLPIDGFLEAPSEGAAAEDWIATRPSVSRFRVKSYKKDKPKRRRQPEEV